MPLILNGCEGRAENGVTDSSGQGPSEIAIYISEFDAVVLDASFRRNPVWRTYGHFSMCLEETVIWESFINFQFQVFAPQVQLLHQFTEELGFQNYPPLPNTNYAIPYVFKWDLRQGVVADVYWRTL